jgi:hypothetical protein
MEDEIIKRDKKSDYAARQAKRMATIAAKKAKTAEPTRMHKQVDDEEPTAAGREGSRLQSRSGRVEAVGRDGEVLSRSSTFVSDAFEIPADMIPKGWSYQWNTVSVHGNQEVASKHLHLMQQQGWRAVPAERYAGTLVPKGSKGALIREGMILAERPMALTMEAQAEDLANAKKLLSDRNESLKLAGVKGAMPDGFEMGGKYKGTGGDIRMSIDKGLDIPAPKYDLAKPGE